MRTKTLESPMYRVNAVQNAPQEASSAACMSSLSSLLLVPCHVLCVQRQLNYLIDFLQQDLVCDVILDASHDLHFMQRILYPTYKRYLKKKGIKGSILKTKNSIAALLFSPNWILIQQNHFPSVRRHSYLPLPSCCYKEQQSSSLKKPCGRHEMHWDFPYRGGCAWSSRYQFQDCNYILSPFQPYSQHPPPLQPWKK